MNPLERFTPTLAEAQARIQAVRPADYARSRNALDGAVTGLSPYITHGFVDLPEVAAGVAENHQLNPQHRFLFELGWREFFRHVWQHQGDAIFSSLQTGPLADDVYNTELPADVREARTGVAVIDTAVRTLYATGYLHNHARMWLASYVVHLRRVHWRAGADWLYAHLLDGDLASNHLSWQWVAGTFSHKPYLFNAENVARYAPTPWHSPGSVIDTSYEALGEIAHGGQLPAPCPIGDGVLEPALHHGPPPHLQAQAASSAAVRDRDVWLIHPWALGALPNNLPADALCVSICTEEFHAKWAWSEARWAFVGARLGELSTLCWHDNTAAIVAALQSARSVRGVDDLHLDAGLSALLNSEPPRQLFAKVERPCTSFSKWWKLANPMLSGLTQNAPQRC
jgi:deoxyribodipyrimidine photo-lyase